MKIISNLGKVLAGILLLGLLAVNIQIGNGGSFFGVTFNKADASVATVNVVSPLDPCDFTPDQVCLWVEGFPKDGKPIVVTPPGHNPG